AGVKSFRAALRTLAPEERCSRNRAQRIQIRLDELVLGIELERAVPQLARPLTLVSFVGNVAELEVDVITELGRQLDRALVERPRLLVARGAVGEIAEVLGELRQRRLVVQRRTRQRLGLGQF